MEFVTLEELRERRIRWSAPGKSEVTHHDHGSLIVPHSSKLSAILCAADVWNCDWCSIMDSKVELCDQSLPVTRMPFAI